MSKKGRPITPFGGSPDDKGSDDDAQPKLKASAATAKGTGINARTKGNAKGKGKGKANLWTEKEIEKEFDRGFPVEPPFRLRHTKNRGIAVCQLMDTRVITSTSIHASPNFEKIMATILEEADAGAFTTKGQVIDRRNELLDIDRREFIQALIPEAAARVEADLSGCSSRA